MKIKDKIIAITGASGFIGASLIRSLNSNGFEVRIIERVAGSDEQDYFERKLEGVDCVIHCAARAHIFNEDPSNSLYLYREANVSYTSKIANYALKHKVKRFIFLSSIGVLGNNTNDRQPFSIADIPNPVDSYAISKFEAECCLINIANNSDLDFVIVRPPLVYGANPKGNFLRLMQIINYGMPLPIAKVNNLRSYISIDNLINFLVCCIDHPSASRRIFLVSDGEDISTPELIRRIAFGMDIKLNFFAVPVKVLRFFAKLVGHNNEFDRFIGTLQVDITDTSNTLNWKPVITSKQTLKKYFNKRHEEL